MARSNWKALQSEKGHVNVSKTNKKRRRRSTRLKKEPVITEETKEAVKSSKPSHMNISNIIDQVKASSPPKKKVKISETKADESAIVEVKKSKKSKRKAKSEKKDDATTKSKSKKKRAKKAIDTDKDTKKVKAKTSQTKAETAEKPKPTEKKDSETLQLDASLDVVHAKMILAQKQVPRKYTQGAPATSVVALDCEMVGVGTSGKRDALARVSVVNIDGDVILDKYVKPKEHVVDFRTQYSGIRPKDIRFANPFEEVQTEVAEIIKNRIVVAHSAQNDFRALILNHPKRLVRDTSTYKLLTGGKVRSLKHLCKEQLELDIQTGEHDSVEDARASLVLYRIHRKAWEKHVAKKARKQQIQTAKRQGV